ncbi:helix-turn-helix transcriptional regulator [Candidatus Woesearchaeota archaeon]|nr:helix-turn-helix transcriptional regulator [Candidatus Woesearchaeota archaeon]
MTKNIIIAPVGDNMNALYVGLKEFPTERVYLLAPGDYSKAAEKASKDLERFGTPSKIISLKGDVWEDMFRKIGEITFAEKGNNVIINTATGDRTTTCAATSAAFVNGIKAFSIEKGTAMLLPVLKFSYYRLLTDRKMDILKMLAKPDCCMSLEELSKKTKMSLPLISYHINGNLKSEGLKEMGLAETNEIRGRLEIKLSMLGRMLLNGYVN